MARRRTRLPLIIYLNGRLVGRLMRQASGAIDFTYDDSWLAWEHAFPVSLSLPLREDRYIGDPVIAVFDNLLPDNADIRRKLAERAHADGADAFSLLGAVGRDCVGALQFMPEGEEPGQTGHISAKEVNDQEIAAILGNLPRAPLGIGEDDDFRISLAGAQEKTALLRHQDRWHLPHGTTATTHILKPEIGRREDGVDLSLSVENEHFCMTLVKALGLPVAATAMATFDRKKALVVERFDRRWTKDGRLLRLPQEDCCQAMGVPPTRKYENQGGPGIADLVSLFTGADGPAHDRKLIIKAQFVFWLLAATDGHAKNFSLFLHPGGRFSMTPLYDVMSLQPIHDTKQLTRRQMKMAMAIGSKRRYGVFDIMPRHFLQTANICGIGESVMLDIFKELRDNSEKAIDTTLSAMPGGFPTALADSIIGGYRSRLKLLDHVPA